MSGYNVYRGTSPGEKGSAPINSTLVVSTTYNDTTASAGTTYYYTVQAVNGSGSGVASGEVSALTYPAAPTGLGAATVSATQIDLSWTAPSGTVSGYNVYRGTSPGVEGSSPINGTLVATAMYNDTTASAGTMYYYIVEAVNDSGSGTASNETSALTYPAAPTGLSGAPISANEIDLAWTAPSGTVSGYNVYRGTSPGAEGPSPINGGTLVATTAFIDTTASAGTTYYYTVEAVNGSGSSAASNEASAPQTYYWTGGAGVWSLGGGGWVDADGHAVNWSDGGIAVFDGASGGAVTISGAVNPLEIDFETNGYALSGGSIALPSAGGVICVDSASATIASPISGGTLAKTGAGALAVSGPSAYTGGTTVVGGTLTITCAAALPSSGLVTIASGGRLVLGGGSGIGSLLAASSPVASSDMATSSAAATNVAAAAPSDATAAITAPNVDRAATPSDAAASVAAAASTATATPSEAAVLVAAAPTAQRRRPASSLCGKRLLRTTLSLAGCRRRRRSPRCPRRRRPSASPRWPQLSRLRRRWRNQRLGSASSPCPRRQRSRRVFPRKRSATRFLRLTSSTPRFQAPALQGLSRRGRVHLWPGPRRSPGTAPVGAAGGDRSKSSAPGTSGKRPFSPKNERVPDRVVKGCPKSENIESIRHDGCPCLKGNSTCSDNLDPHSKSGRRLRCLTGLA